MDLEKDLLDKLIELGQEITHSNIAKTIRRDDLTSNDSMGGY
jgi:hypothetical protein